jgi:hypothetical protein
MGSLRSLRQSDTLQIPQPETSVLQSVAPMQRKYGDSRDFMTSEDAEHSTKRAKENFLEQNFKDYEPTLNNYRNHPTAKFSGFDGSWYRWDEIKEWLEEPEVIAKIEEYRIRREREKFVFKWYCWLAPILAVVGFIEGSALTFLFALFMTGFLVRKSVLQFEKEQEIERQKRYDD